MMLIGLSCPVEMTRFFHLYNISSHLPPSLSLHHSLAVMIRSNHPPPPITIPPYTSASSAQVTDASLPPASYDHGGETGSRLSWQPKMIGLGEITTPSTHSARGKVNNGKGGWGHLPTNVLQ
jgi:hypothetical protein